MRSPVPLAGPAILRCLPLLLATPPLASCDAAPDPDDDERAALEDDEAFEHDAVLADDAFDDEDEDDPSDVDAFAPQDEAQHTTRGPGARDLIAAGLSHTCAARRDGTVRCWGHGTSGQLGDGEEGDNALPTVVSGLTNVTAVAAGIDTSMALRSDGTVWRWGVRWGQVGHPYDPTPQQVPGLTSVTAISAGSYFGCAVRSNGHVWCWGSGTLGDGVTTVSDTPVEVAGITSAIDVDVGSQTNACVLLANGTVKCWGLNLTGQLGDGTTNDSATPVAVQGITQAVDIATDAGTSCVVNASGTVRCWGSNAGGMLGIGTLLPDQSLSSVPAAGISDAVEVDIGWTQHVCARRANGTQKCWGRNDYGQIGNGDGGDGHYETLPDTVVGLDRVVAISNGGHACALRSDGTARCWGHNNFGQIGDGDTTNVDLPATVSGLSATTDGPRIATGSDHTCALATDGTVKCWGDNSDGQLGNGNTTDQSTPTPVVGLSRVTSLATGGVHTCAVIDDGTVKCWGRDVAGELGDAGASGIHALSPVSVVGITDAVQVAASQQSTCVVRSTGTVSCWGSNVYGQLGNGTNIGSNVPVAVSGLTNAVAVDMNSIHVCALTAGSNVKCWGYNLYGELGNGNSGPGASTNTPVTVTLGGIFPVALSNVVAIGVGNTHSCAVIADGTVRCWGAGFDGGLGNGSYADQSHPVTVTGLSDAVDVSLGSSSSCALRATGGVRCWGTNTYGELGHGAGPMTNTPSAVGLFPFYLGNAIAMDSGFDNTCVAKGDGTIACWGLNADGQLGDGTTTNRSLPVAVLAFP